MVLMCGRGCFLFQSSEGEMARIGQKYKEQKPKAPSSISRCLQSASTAHVMIARSMSSLCALAYRMKRITVSLYATVCWVVEVWSDHICHHKMDIIAVICQYRCYHRTWCEAA